MRARISLRQNGVRKYIVVQRFMSVSSLQDEVARAASALKPGEKYAISDTSKVRLFESRKKRRVSAGLLSLLFPSAGHGYAGNWSRGIPFALGELGAVALVVTAGTKEEEIKELRASGGFFGFDIVTETRTRFTAAAYAGLVVFVVLKFWEFNDAQNEVEKYNARLYEEIVDEGHSLSFDVQPIKSGGRLVISYRF
jgi:hypothetical protein